MSPYHKFDVVVVGAGPSGSVLSRDLAMQGVSVLVLDKKKFPRKKPCAGGLTRRAMHALSVDIDDVVEDHTRTAKIFIDNRPIFHQTFDTPIIGMVRREQFDHFLINKATSAGAEFWEDTSFKSVSGKSGNLTIETSKGRIQSRFLVAADGVKSRVVKQLGLKINCDFMTAVEAEVYPRDTRILENFLGTAHYDFGVIPEGYGWIFPKKDHLNIGILSISKKVRGYKHHFESYIKLKDILSGSDVIDYRRHLIPFRSDRHNVFANQLGLAIGDATGYTDPLTGEGIYYAVQSARLAASALMEALNRGDNDLAVYNKTIKKEFHTDLKYANILAFILYKIPSFSYRLLESHSERFGKAQVDIISGKASYTSLFKKLVKPTNLIRVITRH